MLDTRAKKRAVAILRVLRDAGRPLGASRVARDLEGLGVDMSQRTVRYYLAILDEEGLTRSCGKKGREITPQGEEEVANSFVTDKVGLMSARVDEMAYQMTFEARRRQGTIIVNVSTVPAAAIREAVREIAAVFAAGLGMGRQVAVARQGEAIGKFRVPEGRIAIGTVCSVAINGFLLAEGIPTTSRFGGLLEMHDREPVRFTEMIHYAGSSLDPLEIFISGGMTSVREAVRTGRGLVGAGFREVPAVAVPQVRRLQEKLDRIGLGGIVAIGKPNRPLLDIPVPEGRAGLIVIGGLNPLAAVQEAGIETHNKALTGLVDFAALFDYTELAPRLGLPPG
jgi:HTH-type transcriptional regulator, global nitrogen regulator NrpRI